MHTTTLPIQVSGASPNAAPRPNQQASADAGQFSAALSREMAMRQKPAPAAVAPANKPKAAEKAAAAPADTKTAAPEQVKPAAGDSKTEGADGSAKSDEATTAQGAPSDQAAQAAEAAAATPVAEMLALVASFNQLHRAAVPVSDAPGATALPGLESGQFAAMQAAVKMIGAEAGPQAGSAAGFAPAEGLETASAVVPRTALAADDKAPAPQADFRAAQDAAAAKAGPDTSEVSARQTREAVELAALKDPAPVAPAIAQVQPAALEIAQAATGAPTDRLAARVGTPAWNQQVSQKIVWMVAGEEQTASLTLNPPELGPMQVVLSVTNDQATVAFSSNQMEVRQALENALPRLREMMSENGIALGNATVDAGMPDQRQAQDEQGRSGARGGRFGSGGSEGDGAAMPAPRTSVLGDQGLVDTFA